MKIKERDEASSKLLVLFKDGRVEEIEAITGGGQMVAPDSPGYEVHVDRPGGGPDCFYQREIAAVLDLDDMTQVEFGNPMLASGAADHPRAMN